MTSTTNFICSECLTTLGAALTGHIRCLKSMLNLCQDWHPGTIEAAIMGGHVKCLKFLVESEIPLHPDVAYFAAIQDQLNSLRYLYEHCGHLIPWDSSNLENFETDPKIPKHIKSYLRTIEKSWRIGPPKPAKKH